MTVTELVTQLDQFIKQNKTLNVDCALMHDVRRALETARRYQSAYESEPVDWCVLEGVGIVGIKPDGTLIDPLEE